MTALPYMENDKLKWLNPYIRMLYTIQYSPAVWWLSIQGNSVSLAITIRNVSLEHTLKVTSELLVRQRLYAYLYSRTSLIRTPLSPKPCKNTDKMAN